MLLITFVIYRQYDAGDGRSRDAAQNFNYKRGNEKCSGITTNESQVRVVRINQSINNINIDLNELICRGTRKSIVIDQLDVNNCAYDVTPPAAIYVRNTMSNHESDGIKHAFSALSDKFGKDGKLVDVFELFGEFEPGQKNILFSDNAKSLVTDDSVNLTESFFNYDGDDETLYKNIQCHN